MASAFVSAVTPPVELLEPAYWLIVDGFRLLVYEDGRQSPIPLVQHPSDLGVAIVRSQYLGYLEQPEGVRHFFSAEAVRGAEKPAEMEYRSLRQLFTRLDDTMIALAGRAVQIVEWDRTHQFCGRCGIPVDPLPHERAKKCPQCGLTSYPRLSPAIIVRIVRQGAGGEEILLAHNKRHPSGFYSVLAGFVEPGETLEECVRREVEEEVGIRIKNIRYFGSQPWPFPNSLMIAFTAEYAGGEIVLEEDELSEAGWFLAAELPRVPPPISIARQLIDSFAAAQENRR